MRLTRAALAVPLLLVVAMGPAPAAEESSTSERAFILHALSRLTYGPRPADVQRIEAMGFTTWLERQLDPARVDDSATDKALAAFPTLTMSIADLHREYPRMNGGVEATPPFPPRFAPGDSTVPTPRDSAAPNPRDSAAPKRPGRITAELQAARMLRAVRSERQLQEVMVDFWANHFSVFAGKGELRWYTPAWEREVIRPHALGRFPDLLRATARHPAMLFYLDNWLSARADYTLRGGSNAGRRSGLNENYARELMELHTLGVDGGYTQQDVTEVARAFTGWTIERPRAEAAFVFRPAMHDRGAKVVLGRPLRRGGERDGEDVLDLLALHPATARFIAGKLARRFVADEPPPALVERLTGVYRDSSGDVRALLRALVASPEFRAAESGGAKIKKPSGAGGQRRARGRCARGAARRARAGSRGGRDRRGLL